MPMAAIGSYSYSIYLWHLPFAGPIADRLLPVDGSGSAWVIARFAVYCLVSIGLGVLMYRLIEKPALILREQVTPREPRPEAAGDHQTVLIGDAAAPPGSQPSVRN